MSSTSEAILFCCVATIMVLGALGVLFFRKAAYAALCMVLVMLGLAVIYLTHGAAFLGTVQVVVYTGAIMMLFLFVIMMIGLGASDEYRIQRQGNIVAALLLALGLVVILVGVVARTHKGTELPVTQVDPYSNAPVTNLATELFGQHWFTMELSGALLITAAIGAMLLTHTDKLGPRTDQHGTAEAKMRAFKERGRHMGQLPAPGVYAHSNAVDVPALSGETMGPVEESVPRVLRVKGLLRNISQVDSSVADELVHIRLGRADQSVFGPLASSRVPRSGAWGMPGTKAPTGLNDLPTRSVTDAGEPEVQENESTPAVTEEESK
ncbi:MULTISPECIES: NADH-quinone oxidoreductase subunit J [unclassified Schaalia]|uniref:NADH-quinone oxidoreductase subunit J n=1 Tax=unclassified Schaalia TaxID=2691889 RepID=UPI001E612608|nr:MULTISPECIES: NADH-quinone oxidoreductase subunit J [unclassified Schaalia]MCD4549122.1 NADH-quinone oxidoreductase subunit J [Schaalia sp. lx-260]MCD4557310.1 NADH-quinone oxidoreductase subunit J [Schaalia sp. lx-100]